METSRGNERLGRYAFETSGGWVGGSIKTGLSRSLSGLSLRLRGEYTLGFTPGKIEDKWHPLVYSVNVPKEFQRIDMTGPREFFY